MYLLASAEKMAKKQEPFELPCPKEWAEWLKPVNPCPFCGSSNLGFLSLFDWEALCQDCLAEGPKKEDREAAIEAWNRTVR
uniref:Lar family restriction alleviation protein n=2 Tax=Acidithiobacillus thiooxidans TaxID=930 RepID=UPI00384A9857